jgi:hypothetical protein
MDDRMNGALFGVGAAAAPVVLTSPREWRIARASAPSVCDAERLATAPQAPPQPSGHRGLNKAAFGNASFTRAFTSLGASGETTAFRKAGGQGWGTDPVGATCRCGTCSAVLTAVVTFAAARSAILPVVHRVAARGTAGPSIAARVAAVACLTAAAGAARGRTCRAAASHRRIATGTASRRGASSCLRARDPSRASLSGSFNAQVASAFEATIATATSTATPLRTRGAHRIVLPRLRTARTDEQRDRKPEQPPKISQHVVLYAPRASHARQAQARIGLGAPTKEALS